MPIELPLMHVEGTQTRAVKYLDTRQDESGKSSKGKEDVSGKGGRGKPKKKESADKK